MKPRPLPKPWHRARSCPICGGGGCLRAGPHDSPVAVVCAKVVSTRPVGLVGHLHVLSDSGPTWAPWRRSLGRLARAEAGRGR
jgi:hypothetical protein